MDEPTIDDTREIVKLFVDSDLEDLDIQIGGTRIALSRVPGRGVTVAAPATMAVPAAPAATPATPATPAPPAPRPQASPAEAPEPPAPPAGVGSQATAVPATPREGLYEVKAPVLGVFYRRPSPDQAPFVEVGDEVGETDAVCIIDVMKLFNQVRAGCAGRIAEICVEDGAMVEHGQTLMYIEPAAGASPDA